MNYPSWIGGSFLTRALTADNEDLINWYVVQMESQGAATKAALYPTPGVQTLATHTSGVGRGHYALNGREFMVIGTDFLESDSSGVLTSRGTVAIDQNPASIVGNGINGDQLFITSGGVGYTFTLTTNTFAAIVSPPWTSVLMGAFIDGYFIALETGTSKFYASNLLDGTTWSASQFAARSLAADKWVGLYVSGRYIYLLGELTSEIWYDTGASPFPFAPYSIGLIPYGCVAPFSGAIVGQALLWLAQTKQGGYAVVSTAGATPENVTTSSVQQQFNSYTTLSDAVADSYTLDGHTHYVLSFTAANVTWSYDQTVNTWYRQGTWIEEGGMYTVWRPRFHAYAFNQHRMLDVGGAGLYNLTPSVATDVEDRVIRRLRRGPILEYENQRLIIPEFELLLEPGQGLQSGQGSDPQVMLRVSRDGGFTWGPEVWRSAGAAGEYRKRVRWNRLGQGRRIQIEVAVTDPIPWYITGATVKIGGLQARQAQQAVAA